ncbi:MAG: hypothetical protein J0L82_10105 [Deltaproteobacteria bacterium]|jgi:hypothetical protein|nr:hypothetical protein [Deltaproteobacteria bacterium]
MPIGKSWPILIVLVGSKALAFDPFTIATGAQAVSGIMGGLDKIDELADAGFAVSDLLSELEIEPETDQEIEAQVRRLEALENQMRDLRVSRKELSSLVTTDFARAQTFQAKVRRLREMIRTTKRLAALMGFRPKAGEKALKIQETRLQYMILDELMAIRRMQFEEALNSKESRAKFQLSIAKVLDEEGVRTRRLEIPRASRWRQP